jgi:peptide/nickel transport system substrate-binding protein
MFTRRLLRLVSVLLIVVFALSFTSTGISKAQGAVFKGAWPFAVPGVGHFNTFAANGHLWDGIYRDLVQPAAAMYLWASDKWHNIMATGWEIKGEDFVLSLRDDCTWSDGSKFGAKDVVATFNIRKLQNAAVSSYVDKVTAVDDKTVAFHMSNPSSVMPRFVLREPIRPAATYGDIADRAAKLFADGKTSKDADWTKLVTELNEFRPKTYVTSGPFTLDEKDITDTQMTLKLRKESCLAKDVKFDTVILFNGETPAVTPLVMNREVHYATHGFPPATELAFDALGIRILRPPIYSGPALYFNYKDNPIFSAPEFRQAIAYAVDRDQNGAIALGKSGVRQKYMTGFSDNLVPIWLTKEQMAALNPYDHDAAKAEELLKGLGYTRGSDGVFADSKGTKLSFQLTFPAEFADWSGAAQNLADQLNAFGIKIELRGVQFQQHPQDVFDGKFQLAIRDWGAGNPHPNFSYDRNLNYYNTGGQGSETRLGMAFPLTQKVGGKDVDLKALWVATAQGMDVEKQKASVAELAAAYNALLPQIPLWERYGNNPAFPGLSWPAAEDPVYRNSPYADSFVVLMILDGRLAPTAS